MTLSKFILQYVQGIQGVIMFESFVVPEELRPSDPRFGVGPSLVPEKYVQNLLETGKTVLGNSHRKPAVKNLCKEIQEGIKNYFNLPEGYEVCLTNGGATFLFDMMGLGLVDNSSVHFTCGEFSTKWFKSHHKIPWIKAENKSVDFGEGINPEVVSGADMICCTLNETSTGVMLNSLPKDKASGTLLAIDATSGAGQIPVDMSLVDVYFFSPQKVFASEGGFAVCILSPAAVARAEKIASSDRYIPEIMSFKQMIDNSRKNQTYNTPSVSTLFFLNEQIKKMNELGEETVFKMAKEKAEHVYSWADSKSYLSCYIQEEKFRSLSVATIDVDDKYSAADLSKVLREQNVALDIDSYRKLGRNQFRISLFHNITLNDIQKLTKIIDQAVESVK